MPTILLVRHGETHWNRSGRIQGGQHMPSPLTLKGIDQARAYGRRLAGMADDSWRVFSSPLARALQTSAILCETAGIDFARVQFDERLREVDTGLWSGRDRAEMRSAHPELFDGKGENSWYFNCPGGERHGDLAARLGSWLAERRAGEKAVVVSHRVATRVLMGLYLGLDPVAALAVEVPQDRMFMLRGGKIEILDCGA